LTNVHSRRVSNPKSEIDNLYVVFVV
jgi:hypothetical protein